MPDQERLSSTVTWATTGVPAWTHAWRWVPTILGSVLSLVMSVLSLTNPGGGGWADFPGGPESVDPPVPMDPRLALSTRAVKVRGTGGGMPPRYATTERVTLYRNCAKIASVGEPELPLQSMRIEHARPRRLRLTRRNCLATRWNIRVVGPEIDLTFRGPWLMLAQLGKLGGWSEPS